LQQDWHYHWFEENPTVPVWTVHEKRNFHHALDRQIWGKWSMRVKLQVGGTSDFARKFSKGVPINFDVHWVLAGGHWQIYACKLSPGGNQARFNTRTSFSIRKMWIATGDIYPYNPTNMGDGFVGHRFIPIPHEFGHALGAPDENRAAQANINDHNSIMNVGKQLRSRHLDLVLSTLNGMIPHTTFSAPVGLP